MCKKCINCGAEATCEHHVIPLSLGGNDISSNKVPLCDSCHALIHNITVGNGHLSHSELVKAGVQRKKEAISRGESYKPRRKKGYNDFIGRPKLKKEEIPEHFLAVFRSGNYKNITDLAKQVNMSRTTVYKYIELLKS